MDNNTYEPPYFYIKENKENAQGIRLYNSLGIPNKIEDYNKEFYRIPNTTIIEIDKTDSFIFPDILTESYPLVSEKFIYLFEIYDIKVFVKRALLIDRYSRQSKSYYFIYTANLQPTDVNKDFNVVEFEEGKFKFIVSFDFAESLARREVEGIEFIEVEEDVV